MKEKKRLHFPILLKVILLGVIASFVAGTIAVVVSYNNMISKAKADLESDGIAALEYANKYYDLTSDVRKTDSFTKVRDYVLQYYPLVKNDEPAKYKSFLEYEQKFETVYPFFYPKGMIGSPEYLAFKAAYNDINDVLLNASFYASQYTFYAIKDPDNDNRFVFICESRHSTLIEKNTFYFIPGSHYDLQSSDQIYDIGHSYIKGYKLASYETKFMEIKEEVNDQSNTIAYMFVAYETSRVANDYAPILRNEILALLGSGLAVIVLYAVLSYFMFVRNINKLNRAAVDASNQLKSNKPFKAINPNIRSRDEIKTLEDSFILMEEQIVNYVDIIKKDAKDKEKINAELEIASKIQLEALPKSCFEDQQVSIRTFIKPAKEVGGDFYDYFYLNDHEIVIVMSDVSGKGIPASLFMMKSKELIKSQLLSGKHLAESVKEANEILCKNNQESLFVTSFIGIVDFEKEEIVFVNAGHEKPYIISKNKVTKLDGDSNFVLGGVNGLEFKEERCAFHKGDIIFMFTDGLNESINSNEEEFSYKRIEETLKKSIGSPIEDYISNMKNALADFVKKEEAFDDVTMMILESKDPTYTMSFDKKDPSIIEEAVNEFNKRFVFIEDEKKAKVGIILDELLNNLVSYEKREDLHIDVKFSVIKDDLQIDIISNGEKYDPFSNNKKKYLDNFSHEIEEGGFGVTIVESLAKKTKYEYKNKLSHLTIIL